MIDPTRIDYGRVSKVARDGSPLLLQALGRLYGVGPVERRALGAGGFGGGVPTWAWVVLATGAGITIGARLQKRFPRQMPKLISGR